MDEHTLIDLPKVTIAMAVYKPNINWLEEQLHSLNQQDYKGEIELLVWNDSPDDFDAEPYLKQHITQFEYKILSDGENHGVTVAFENLTKAANSEYISYCDQDDIWDSKKISKSVEFMQSNPQLAACHCNLSFVDRRGKKLNRVFLPKEKLKQWNDFEWQFRKILVRNQSYGCALLMKTEIAKEAIPFIRCIYHDQWLALYAIQNGGYKFMEDVLIYHREHGDNASARLTGIKTKEDYYKKKLQREYKFFHEAKERGKGSVHFNEPIEWIDTRVNYQCKLTIANFVRLLCFAKVRWDISFFELMMPFIPKGLFGYVISRIR